LGFVYWIASYPKSGNTWMRTFIATVFNNGERPNLDQLRQIAPDDNHGQFYRPLLDKPIELATLEDLARVRPAAQQAMANALPRLGFLKTHSALVRHLGSMTINAEITAGAIYLVRHPLDVAVSYSDFRDRDVDETIARMEQSGFILPKPERGAYRIAGSWSENVQSWTRQPHDRLLVLRYEDLLADPLATFGKVIDFLRLPLDPGVLERSIAATSFAQLQAAEASQGFVERPAETKAFFREGRAGQWRERLTEAQVARLVVAHHEQMRRFGYWEPAFEGYLSAAR